MEPTPTPAPGIPEEEEFYSSWSLFLVCLLLILSLWTSYYLQIKRIRAAGMTVGLIVRMAPGTAIREMLTFKHTLFFNLLLPPIILNSGYELKQENFFRNFGSILTFAFLGTFISAVGVGILVYVYSFLGLESLDLGLVECLKFGSTLSATDPVTILAIFNQYKVDPKLYTVIFGESLLNDAVSIVMYDSIFKGIGIFLASFSVSMALGVAFGLGMSLLLKHSHLNLYPSIESCLVALLRHYAYHTMSRRTQRATKYIFSTLAQLSENFIFIYLGMSLFTSPPTEERVTSYVKPLFIVITTVAVIFTRYAAVFPLSEAINFFHRHVRGQRQEELPHSYQMMLFWAGLRGAVGVALAAGFTGPNAQTLRMTVLVVVVLTVLLFGGTTARMLEVWGIRTGVEDEGGSSDEDEGGAPVRVFWRWAEKGRSGERGAVGPLCAAEPREPGLCGGADRLALWIKLQPSAAGAGAGRGCAQPQPGRTRHASGRDGVAWARGAAVGEDGKWFQALDERYLLPLFSNATASRTFHARRAQRRSTHNLSTSGGGAEGSAGPSVAGTPAGSDDEADVAGGEDEDAVELGVPLEQRLPGRTGTRPGNINIQPAQSRVAVGRDWSADWRARCCGRIAAGSGWGSIAI
ncbi:Sodium/hydrogen exchanger family-domain-containing protein [Mycena olivaceomarginata]|nr:Sodium/hydrogen exchanger family-domain-containing protein [Mycena olivaceomarginata]